MKNKLRKTLSNTLDEILIRKGIDKDVRLFSNPVDDFDFSDMSVEQMRLIREHLTKKISKHEVQT